MNGILAPFNEKREQAIVIVFEAERFPVKYFAIGTLTRTGLRALEFDSLLAQPRCEPVQIVAMRGPADKPRFLQFCNNGVLLHTRLLWIGGNDFKITARAKREQSVLRAASGMNTSKSSVDAGALVDEGDSVIEIVAAEKNVIERRRIAYDLGLSRANGRCNDRARGGSEKSSARDVLHFRTPMH